MARLRPVSAFHFFGAPRALLPSAACDFVSSALPLRAQCLSNAAVSQPLLFNSHRFVTTLDALASSARALHPDDPRSIHDLSAAADHTSVELTHLLDVQRAQIATMRAADDSSSLASLSATLDALQYDAIGCRTLVANIQSLTAGRGPVVKLTDALETARDTADAIRAFAVEKFGAAPEIHVTRAEGWRTSFRGRPVPPPATFHGVPEYYRFVLVELIKNAIAAMVHTFGALRLDDVPAIRVSISADESRLGVCVSDDAGGLPSSAGAVLSFPYFASTSVVVQDSYHYSRTHGAPFSGLGLGLVRARLYARHLGGDLCLVSQPGRGVDAHFFIDRSGKNSADVWDASRSRL
jgi:signal transduction histidine kinase